MVTTWVHCSAEAVSPLSFVTRAGDIFSIAFGRKPLHFLRNTNAEMIHVSCTAFSPIAFDVVDAAACGPVGLCRRAADHAPGLLPHRQRHPETFSFDRVVIEPLPWPGDMSKTIDDTNLGNYFFEVRDRRQRQAAVLARIRLHLQRVVRHRGSQEAESHFFRIAAVSCSMPRR